MPREGQYAGNDDLTRTALRAVRELEIDLPIATITQQGSELHITLYGGRMVIWPPRGAVTAIKVEPAQGEAPAPAPPTPARRKRRTGDLDRT